MEKLSFSSVPSILFLKIGKYLAVALFVFLTFFNVNLLVDDEGWGIKLVNEVFALPEDETGGNGTSGGKATMFFNYGTWVETKYCQRTSFGFPQLVNVEWYFAEVYWMVEYCLYGGKYVECTYGTVRKTYQGGGC